MEGGTRELGLGGRDEFVRNAVETAHKNEDLWGSEDVTKTSNCIRAQDKFVANAMETAHKDGDPGETKMQEKQASVRARKAHVRRMPWK